MFTIQESFCDLQCTGGVHVSRDSAKNLILWNIQLENFALNINVQYVIAIIALKEIVSELLCNIFDKFFQTDRCFIMERKRCQHGPEVIPNKVDGHG